MRVAAAIIVGIAFAALPASAVEFFGVELCQGSTDTAVDIPIGSSLVLESVEIGDHGGLVMLLSARSGKVMDHVDDLMTGLTGTRGSGDGDTLEWTGDHLTAVAQKVAKKYAALAVTSDDGCPGAPPAPPAAASVPPSPSPVAHAAEPPAVSSAPDSVPVPAAAAAVAASSTPPAAAAPPDPAPEPAPAPVAAATPDFQVVGAISHSPADQTWVDVMGVVANHTATGYRLASFDLSLYDADGRLICVDTVSVSVLKAGQQRAFRDAIRCPGYDADDVARIELQFAGGL